MYAVCYFALYIRAVIIRARKQIFSVIKAGRMQYHLCRKVIGGVCKK